MGCAQVEGIAICHGCTLYTVQYYGYKIHQSAAVSVISPVGLLQEVTYALPPVTCCIRDDCTITKQEAVQPLKAWA